METLRADQILSELRDLWAGLAGADDPHGVVRACAMTLIVVGDDTQVGATLAELMREHPHRAIVVRVRPGPAALLEHRVLAQCWMPSAGRQQICCEQIEIAAAEGGLADLPPVLLALRAPDLPVVLWLRAARLFDVLRIPAGKLILDSAAAAEPLAMLQRLAQAGAADGPVADLAWTRLTHWREILAQEFDNPASAALLPRVAEVRVFHTGQSVPPEACYMAGWVLSALGRRVEVRFEAAAEGAIEFRGPGFPALRISGCAPRAEASLLSEELGILDRDPVYDRALRLAASLG
ncbi:MAG: glucose-6-phosphate dehydrogenase assembly protein OpcA [Bryobacteraceae bacterium]